MHIPGKGVSVSCVRKWVSGAVFTTAVLFSATVAFSGITELECSYRVEVDSNGLYRTDQARLGLDPDGTTRHRTWAEFDISSLRGQTVTGVGFRVFNDWAGTGITSLRYSEIQPFEPEQRAYLCQQIRGVFLDHPPGGCLEPERDRFFPAGLERLDPVERQYPYRGSSDPHRCRQNLVCGAI